MLNIKEITLLSGEEYNPNNYPTSGFYKVLMETETRYMIVLKELNGAFSAVTEEIGRLAIETFIREVNGKEVTGKSENTKSKSEVIESNNITTKDLLKAMIISKAQSDKLLEKILDEED